MVSDDGLEEEERTEGRRKRRKEVGENEGEGGEDGADWEGVRRRGGGGEAGKDVHYLLPLKARGRLVLQPPVPNPNGKYTLQWSLSLWSILTQLQLEMNHSLKMRKRRLMREKKLVQMWN